MYDEKRILLLYILKVKQTKCLLYNYKFLFVFIPLSVCIFLPAAEFAIEFVGHCNKGSNKLLSAVGEC